jgi:predicted ATP-dependent protease
LIPLANVKHLMLRRDVIEAVEAGQFHVYPVDHVDLCLELLTGLPAGERDQNGEFPQGSVNQKICERLLDLAAKRRAFSGAGLAQEEDANAGKAS